MIDVEKLRKYLAPVPNEWRSEYEVAESAIRLLTEGRNPLATLQALCDGEISLSRLEAWMPRSLLQNMLADCAHWINAYAGGTALMRIGSRSTSAEEMLAEYYRVKALIDVLEEHSIISIENFVIDSPSGVQYDQFKFHLLEEADAKPAARNERMQWSLKQVGPTYPTCAIFVGDGSHVLAGLHNATLALWHVESGQCKRTFFGHTGAVLCVAASADGKLALSGSADATLRLWDLQSGACLRVFEGDIARVKAVQMSDDGRRAISGSWDNRMRLWDVASGKCLRIFNGGYNDGEHSFSTLFALEGNRALSTTIYCFQALWDLEAGKCLRTSRKDRFAAISNDGKLALATDPSDTFASIINLTDVDSRERLRTFEGFDELGKISFSRDDKQVLCAGSSEVSLWDVQSGTCIQRFEVQEHGLQNAAFNSDASRIVTASMDHFVRIWDAGSGKCLHELGGDIAQARRDARASPVGPPRSVEDEQSWRERMAQLDKTTPYARMEPWQPCEE